MNNRRSPYLSTGPEANRGCCATETRWPARGRVNCAHSHFRVPRSGYPHDLRFPRPDRSPVAHPRRSRLCHPHPGAGPGHPADSPGPRPDGRGADWHRQDRRFRPAAVAAADDGRPGGGQQLGARPGAGADPRTGRAGAAELSDLRPGPAAAQLCGVRRGQHQPADDEAAQGPRRAGRHPRAPARPVPAERGQVQPAAGAGARRGRPHARPARCCTTR